MKQSFTHRAVTFFHQGYLDGELQLTPTTVEEYITRVGARIYESWYSGVIDTQTANDSLDSLNVCEDLWIGMPEIPESDGPYTVWFVDTFENRTRIRTYESLKDATAKAARVFNVTEAGGQFGCGVHITDGRGETISSQEVQ